MNQSTTKIQVTTIIIDHDVNEELEKKLGILHNLFPKIFLGIN